MSDEGLLHLAEAAGVMPNWRDARGDWHSVAPDTLRTVLSDLGLPAGTDAEIADSTRRVQTVATPPLQTMDEGETLSLPAGAVIEREDGAPHAGSTAGLPPGYHRLTSANGESVLAVAPARCFGLADAAPGTRPWGLAAQIYALRRDGDGGIGDFAALAEFAANAARHGAAAIAISPVHAQFSADPDRFSPYSPSSRLMLNVLHTPIPQPGAAARDREAAGLVDWPGASRARLAALRQAFDDATPETLAGLAAFRAERGDALETHARFEALHAAIFSHDLSRWHWRTWPEAFRHPSRPEVTAFAHDHAEEVAFHAYVQWLAAQSLGAAQQAALSAGMPIGLVADLAVGADGGGSHCWARQSETLLGLTIGAPPDLLSITGQNWGLAAFSPRGLAQTGYAAYLEMLRAAMRYAGGIRIDHVMGLTRLWVIPDGAASRDGAYLRFPLQDLLRLIKIESHRHRAIVLGEDLGTVPEGFTTELFQAGILGMRVLWFERDDQRFFPANTWPTGVTAMTTTHDLPTVAGWWSGRDLAWREQAGQLADPARDHQDRIADRPRLWSAFLETGAAEGEPPAPGDANAIAAAALRHVGHAPADFAVIPVEDALALEEQPNLPGTRDEHPNWRRRFAGAAATLLDDPATAARLTGLRAARNAA